MFDGGSVAIDQRFVITMNNGRIDPAIDWLIKGRYDLQTVASQNEGHLFRSFARTESQNGLFRTHKFNPKMLCHGRGLTGGRKTKRDQV